ncbi:hypothetical protein CYY_005470 [Polysphondylium violaceum]|uniref:Transmembrane protein n=1 Tax=Polysphondylium violaceum TaxID=133409 RepID=A0A8J4PV09_9MYCE|nr:hypothetical protein CYY_005470 [Polysphondylium violaceum]
MKSISLCFLLCLIGFGLVNSQYNYLGYGDLSPLNVFTIDKINQIQYNKYYQPSPRNILGFAGLSLNSNTTFNVIYSNSADTISWGLLDFQSGGLSKYQTFELPTFLQVNTVADFAIIPNNNTLLYLGSSKTYNGFNQFSLVANQNGPSAFQTVLPVSVTPFLAQGTLDKTLSDYYFVVSLMPLNHYQCILVDVSTNQILKNITISAPQTSQIFQTFANNGNLYIVQPDSIGAHIETYQVDWSDQTMVLAARVNVTSPPTQLQVSVSNSYFAIFSIGTGDTNATAPLIDLSSFEIVDFLSNLGVAPLNSYFIF